VRICRRPLGKGEAAGNRRRAGAEPAGTIERHVRSRGPNSTATVAKARIAATSAIAARGRSSVSRVRTLRLRGSHPFRYGRRLPEDAGVTVFSLGTGGSQFTRRVFDCTFKRGRAAVDARSTRVPEGLINRAGEKRVWLRPREPFHDQEAGRVSVVAVSG